MSTTTTWDSSDLHQIDEDVFGIQEKKQLQNAYRNFLNNTKSPYFHRVHQDSDDDDSTDEDDEDLHAFFHSKVELFQMFLRTQSIDIRQFGLFHREQERIFTERLFYLVLNNIELTNFSTFNFYSIIHLSKELEKYQHSTKKIISNPSKVNGIVQFVLSFSPSTVSTFHLNNLFYLLLNDMNDFSGKIIDRVAELLRIYHFMTYGHPITKQQMITTIDHAIHTANFANPVLHPLYENFLNASYIYKGPFIVSSLKTKQRISLYTIIQNLAIVLLGLTLDDFEMEESYLSISSEHCYHIRLVVRRLTFIFLKYRHMIEYPLENLDKQIVLHLIKLIIKEEKSSDSIRRLLDLYMNCVHSFAETKIKRLLYDLLINGSFQFYALETIRYFLEMNRLNDESHSETTSIFSEDNLHIEDDLWLNDEQIRLVTHRLYSREIYYDVFIPLINGDCQEKRTIDDILNYLDQIPIDDEHVIDVHEMKNKLTILA